MIYKYQRVSTRKQSVGRQEMILDKLGIIFDKAYTDKMSGKDIDRPELNKLKLEVNEGINTDGDGYKFILTILGAVAEMERENTVERVQQGVARCIETGTTKTGKWFGREEKKVEDLSKDFKK